MKKNLDVTKPHYSEQILPVPWLFIMSRFHFIKKKKKCKKKIVNGFFTHEALKSSYELV